VLAAFNWAAKRGGVFLFCGFLAACRVFWLCRISHCDNIYESAQGLCAVCCVLCVVCCSDVSLFCCSAGAPSHLIGQPIAWLAYKCSLWLGAKDHGKWWVGGWENGMEIGWGWWKFRADEGVTHLRTRARIEHVCEYCTR